MYNNILFIVFVFIFSLVYINKFKKEGFQSECKFSTVFIGGVYNKLKLAYNTDNKCRAGCLKDPNCKSYSWNISTYKCSHLPNSVEYVKESADWTRLASWRSYNKICESNTTESNTTESNTSESNTSESNTSESNTTESNTTRTPEQTKCKFSTMFPGGVYNMLKPAYNTDRNCRAGCLKDTNCKSYSWNMSQSKCSHLSRPVEYVRDRNGWSTNHAWSSYNKICESDTTLAPVQPKFCKFNSPREGLIDTSRASKTYKNKSDNGCRNMCLTYAICRSYSYHTNEKHCYLYTFNFSDAIRLKRWRSMPGGFGRTYDKICQDSPFTTTTAKPSTTHSTSPFKREPGTTESTKSDKVNTIFKYNIKENIVENTNSDKLMKSYTFDTDSKIIVALEKTESDNFFISFYVKFDEDEINTTPSSETKSKIFIKHISQQNKNYWSMFRYNNNIYYSINKGFHKLLTPIKNEYYKIVVSWVGSMLTFRVNNEPQDITIDNIIKPKSYIVFGGSKDNMVTGTSNFKGSISEIIYAYKNQDGDKATQMEQCKFYPKGANKTKCVSDCLLYNKINCKKEICNELCNSCNDKITCQWLPAETEKPNPVPNAPDPIRTTAGNKRIIVEWKKPFEGTNGKIVSYIITVKEAYPRDKSSNDEMIYNFDATDCENCQYEIKDLKNTIYYDISVKSQNRVLENNSVKNNISSTCSNIETVAPIGPINVKDYHPSLVESDEEIKMIYNKNPTGENVTCDQKKYKHKYSIIDNLDMNKYSELGILNTLTDGKSEFNNLNNNNNNNYNISKIQDDIQQYLGDIE